MEKLTDIEQSFTSVNRQYRYYMEEENRKLHERINKLEVQKSQTDNIIANLIDRFAEIQNWIDKIAKPKNSPTG